MSPVEPQQDRRPGQLSLVEQDRETARKPGPAALPQADRPRTAPGRPQSRRRLARWLGLLALLCAAAGVTYWLMRPPSVAVVQPRRGPAVQAVYATGTVEPSVMVPIAARSAARLVELKADEGDTVKQGQLLARLENDDLRRAIEMAGAEERYAKAQLDRTAQLLERQVTARSAYDRAKADWEKAQAARARAETEAGFLNLVAPADGIVIRRDGEIGQLINANQSVFWLSCCAPLRISTEVDEEDIAQVRTGQQVLIRADAFPGEVFHGQVHAITPKGDPVARTYRVRVSLPQDTPLMIGMTAETNIVLRQADNALLLPAGAVRQDTVWLVEGGHLASRHVAIGAKGATEVEILSGISDGDVVVATPPTDVKIGASVRPVAAAPAPATKQ